VDKSHTAKELDFLDEQLLEITQRDPPVIAEKEPSKVGVKKTEEPKKKEGPKKKGKSKKEEVSEDEKEEGDESIDEAEFPLPGIEDDEGNVIIPTGVSFCYN
jgi:hypothetical protein